MRCAADDTWSLVDVAPIQFPDDFSLLDEPFVPDVRRLYWLQPVLLDPSDPEPSRPAAVLVVPHPPRSEILVAQRSSTEENGEYHEAHRDQGLNKAGWFSRLRTIDAQLWTPNNARSIDLLLDEESFARVWNDLVPEGFA